MTITKLTRRTFAGALGLTVASAVGQSGRTADQSGATPAPVAYPTGAGDLVLRIDISGGLIPAAALLTELPGFSLFGDGRVIFLGPQIEIYPPPALPNLRTARFSEQGMQMVLEEAAQAGLLDGSQTYTHSLARDAPTTTFTINAAHQSIIVVAYALGIGEDPNWSQAERAARTKLFAFAQHMASLPQSLPPSAISEPESTYRVDRFQIVVEPITATAGAATPAGQATPIPQPPMDWPLPTPLRSSGTSYHAPGHIGNARCAEISGADATTLLQVVQSANALTPWRSDGNLYRLYIRPLLPDESGCRLVSSATPAATPVR